ncbi:MAG: uridine kinase [Bacillota bacterium]
MNTIIIGVAGGTGSGKTTVSKKLFQAFDGDAIMISHDYYYKNNTHLSFEERVKQNYDHPNALDTDMLAGHLADLKAGKSIDCPQYSFDRHIRTDEILKLSPAQIVIVDGILIFENKELRDLFDIKIFVDTDADVRFIRRLKRDVKKRGRSMESVIDQYLTTVKIMHDQFVEPSKKFADIIVPEGGKNMIAVDMLINGINAKRGEASLRN